MSNATTHAKSAEPLTDEEMRQRFEVWFVRHVGESFALFRTPSGGYEDEGAANYWSMWCAARKEGQQ